MKVHAVISNWGPRDNSHRIYRGVSIAFQYFHIKICFGQDLKEDQTKLYLDT